MSFARAARRARVGTSSRIERVSRALALLVVFLVAMVKECATRRNTSQLTASRMVFSVLRLTRDVNV